MAGFLLIVAMVSVACGSNVDSRNGKRPDWRDVDTEVFDPRCDPPPCSVARVELKEQSPGEWVKLVCCNPGLGEIAPD
jgi:hypothetical protein